MGDTISPFIPGTRVQFAWDSTSLGLLKECARKYYYTLIEGWRARENSVHLDFGLLYHAALENYDKYRVEGMDHDKALRFVVNDILLDTWDREKNRPVDWGHNVKTRETLVRTVIWYLDQFKDDAAVTYKLADGRPAVELSFRFELSYGPRPVIYTEDEPVFCEQPYVLCGHLDRIVSYQDSLYVMDRKTTSSYIGPDYFAQFEPDNQMTLYTLASRVVFNAPVRGVIIDAAQIQVGGSKFGRGLTYRTERQLEEWLDDTKHWLRQAEGFAEENYWPMNDKSCHKYGGCVFRSVCSQDPAVREAWLKAFVKKPWNPLEVR